MTFSGRASRSEYWWFQLFFWGLLIALFVLFVVVADATHGPDGPSSPAGAIAVIMGLFILAMFLPQTSLNVRRFHDRNRSGWWYLAMLIFSIVVYFGRSISVDILLDRSMSDWWYLAALLENILPYFSRGIGIGIIVLSSLKGTEGPNKYGPDPLRPEIRAEVFA